MSGKYFTDKLPVCHLNSRFPDSTHLNPLEEIVNKDQQVGISRLSAEQWPNEIHSCVLPGFLRQDRNHATSWFPLAWLGELTD